LNKFSNNIFVEEDGLSMVRKGKCRPLKRWRIN